jgi:RNA polymerase sigma factor (sigma-70 family)
MSHDDAASSAETFERFLKATGPKMKRLLTANHIPIEDAEDVLQQALLALVYQWDSIRDPESWLLGTLRRHCLMYWRNHRRQLYSAVDSTLLEWLSQPVAPPQERSDLLYDLRHMIERLPARCRSLLELRFQLGYEPAEVARRLGYRDKSIGKVTNRCLAALAREMVGAAVMRALPAATSAPLAAPPVPVMIGSSSGAGMPASAPASEPASEDRARAPAPAASGPTPASFRLPPLPRLGGVRPLRTVRQRRR